jgi:hypothetical protein
VALAATLLFPVRAGAQAAAAVEPVLRDLDALHPLSDQSFPVHGITLTRDAGVFSLVDGRVWPLSQVNGRTIGAVYVGSGIFRFTPPNAIERRQLQRYLSTEQINVPIKRVVFLFADGTLDSLRRGTAPSTQDPGGAGGLVDRAIDYLKVGDNKTFDPVFLGAVLNGEDNGSFNALIDRDGGEDLLFAIDPDDREGVSLAVHSRVIKGGNDPELVSQFTRRGVPLPHTIGPSERRAVEVDRYVLDVQLPSSLDGGVTFSATGALTLRVPEGRSGPWVPFGLYPELDIDSVRWNGTPVPFYKNHDGSVLWVRAPGPLLETEHPTLVVGYHGSLIDRYGDWFYLKESIAWYPVSLEVRATASFDITYHTPVGYPIASTGTRTDSSLAGRTVTTRWVHPDPMRNASFNIGRFQSYDISAEGSPPISLLWSETSHRAIARDTSIEVQGNVREIITDEMANAMRFYSHVFGPPEEGRFYVTESPGNEGLAFPGMVDLSWYTFLETDKKGVQQVFRAHEAAHQWWGISVDFASYHDQWLSEGLADFSGLWYLQTRRGTMAEYLDLLRTYRSDIFLYRDQIPATSLGWRGATGRLPQLYQYAVYEKGAWTMHMLRTLLLQLSTMNEDRFTAAMQEFYATHRGSRVSTLDLQRVMEKHAGADLSWFFDEWVDGAGIPTYTWASQTTSTGDGHFRLQLRVKQTQVSDSFQMYVPVTVELKDGRMLRTRMHVTGPVSTMEIPLPVEVKSVKFNDFEGVLAEVKSEGW